MRNFPSSADLSREQQAIYSEHLDKALLIIGPPGTGKTVMAIMRAQRMQEQNNETARILMHNTTLREFTHSQARDIEVETMQKYLKKKYNLSSRELNHTGKYEFPWISLYTRTKHHLDTDQLKKIFPRQIIIDEGQDFPMELWEILSEIWIKLRKENINFVPSVMADENQRLNQEANSNIDDIRNGLGLYTDCFDSFKESSLTKNYRNTQQIAAFAKHFYVGNQTETPSSEDCRSGSKPILFFHKSSNHDVLIERVLQYKINNPNKTIGILVAQNASRTRVETIGLRLQGEVKKRDLSINVQYYISNSKIPLKELNFDTTNTITVLTKQSSKGLEFDCVFVPSLNDIEYSDQGFLYAMDLYVVFHRARDQLFLGSNLSASEIKNKDILIPDILYKPLRVTDYKGKPLQIGFSNKSSLEEFVNIEDGIIDIKKAQSDQNLASNKQEKVLKENERLPIPELEKNEILYVTNETNEAHHMESQKLKEKKLGKEDEDANKINEALKFIKNLSHNAANAAKLEEKIALLSFGDRNVIRMKWHNLIKPKKVKVRKENNLSKNIPIAKIEKNELPKLEISIVSGNKADMYMIHALIKEYLIDKNQSTIQVISLKKNKNKVFKSFHRFLSQNLSGIANYIIPDQTNTKIIFQSKTRKKSIEVLDHGSEILWKSKIIILGLEDLKKEDFEDKKIEELLINISLMPEQLVNIIHPNTAEETPGVLYMNSKNDDGSLETKYYEF